MSDPSAIPFVRRTANERVDGTLTVKIDIEPMYKLQFLRMFPEIGAAGALAALTIGAQISEEKPKSKVGDLCRMACNFCEDPVFWRWVTEDFHWVHSCNNADDAKAFILNICSVDSRKNLDHFAYASTAFHEFIRLPFLAWKTKQ